MPMPPREGSDLELEENNLRDRAIAVWRDWLVAVHRPRRIETVKERYELRKRMSRANVNIAAGNRHSMAVRQDGRIACWGRYDDGQAPPGGVDGDFVAVAAGDNHSLVLRQDGSVACWGYNDWGQAPPAGVDGDFVAVAAGYNHSLVLRRDGSIACLGSNRQGQAPPDGVDGDFVAIAAGLDHSLAIRRDGSIACWGYDDYGEALADVAELNATPFMTEIVIL